MALSARVSPGLIRSLGQAMRGEGIGGAAAHTAGFNIAAAAAASLGGVLMARVVGPAVRGEYAAVTSWFGMLLMVGQVGQAAAVCFYVAHEPGTARGYVATARATMLATGAVALIAGVFAAPALAPGNPSLVGAYRLMFGAAAIAFTGASYTAALQARDIRRWNLVRVSQPVLGLAALILLWRLRLLGLHTAVDAIIVSMAIQLGYAYFWCRRRELAPGCARAELAGPLLKYGLSQIAATMPASVNASLDQLVLARLTPPAELGCYAIAVSVTLVPVPLVSAIGNVAFPWLAAQRQAASPSGQVPRAAMLASAGLASAVLLPLAACAQWLIPLVFGVAYRSAVPLVWLLTPGGVFLACGQVAGDLLRGLGRPRMVAAAEGLAAVFTVVLLIALLPVAGVAAAAIASTIAYGVALAMMTRSLRRLASDGPPQPPTGRGRRGRHRQLGTSWPWLEGSIRDHS